MNQLDDNRLGRPGQSRAPLEATECTRRARPVAEDDPRVLVALDDYLSALNQGREPDVQDFLTRHADIADVLAKCLAGLKFIQRVAPQLDQLEASANATASLSFRDLPQTGCLGDFRLVRELGRGGMGVVYEAEQISLGRRVALKILPFAAALDTKQLQRFKNEAQAAAHLHHQNIVPVYAVGCERGVHFYAMQFIEGQTLASVIADVRLQRADLLKRSSAAGGGARATEAASAQSAAEREEDAAPETAAQARLSTLPSGHGRAFYHAIARLGIQAAEALDYSHELGIVHRDIKPANLLVDGRGKLWITDFGLAHCQSQAGLTMSGDLIGTLRYMSPEQALAKRVVVDHRTDIYSLGATLYELLTLEPVFPGADRQELLRQIAFEEPKPLRRHNKSIPGELETIVLKGLEKNAADRYATAKKMSDDLERFLSDEPIRARRASLARRLRRLCRRHRSVATGLIAIMLTAVLLGGGFLWWQEHQRADTAQAVAKYLADVDTWQEQGHWAKALDALERAAARLAVSGPGPLRDEVESRRRDAALVVRLEQAHQIASDEQDGKNDYAESDLAYGRAFAQHGLDVKALPQEIASQIRASSVRRHLVTALDHWTYVTDLLSRRDGERLRAIANLADDDAWRKALRDPRVAQDQRALISLADGEAVLDQPPINIRILCYRLECAQAPAAAVRLLRRAQQRHPTDFSINMMLAFHLQRDKATTPAAIGFLRAALVSNPQSPVVYARLGLVLAQENQLAEAEAILRKAIALRPNACACVNLGVNLVRQGRLPEAEAAYLEAIKLQPDFELAHRNLVLVLARQGKLAEALAHGPAVHRNLAKSQRDEAEEYAGLAGFLGRREMLSQAESASRKAVELGPNRPIGYYILGDVLHNQKKFLQAVEAYRKAVELSNNPPSSPNVYNAACAAAMAGCGQSEATNLEPKERAGLRGQARDWLRSERNAYDSMLRKEPDKNGSLVRARMEEWQQDADFNGVRGDEALALLPEAERRQWQSLWDEVAELESQAAAAAVTARRRAIELRPKNAPLYDELGVTLYKQLRLSQAEQVFRKAIELNPKFTLAYADLGRVLCSQDRLPEAERASRKAIELRPEFPKAYNTLANILRAQRKLSEADAAQRKAAEYGHLAADVSFGYLLMGQGRFTEALATFKGVQELDSSETFPTASFVHWAERYIQLDAKLSRVLKGEAQDANGAERIAFAELCQLRSRQLYAAAARFYSEAFAKNPALVGDMRAGIRYGAACAAAQAGCGLGTDADNLETPTYARLRGQALAWLRADLMGWRLELAKGPAGVSNGVQYEMRQWQYDSTLNCVRGDEALAKLPEAERREWTSLWEDVEELRKQTIEQAVPRGFVRTWLVLSELLPYEGDDGAKALGQQQIPQEALLRPRAGERVEVNGKTLSWKEHHSSEAFIDFAALHRPPSEYRLAYAVCYIHSDADRADLVFRVGSDDQALIYLNGEEVYRNTKARVHVLDEDSTPPLRLRRGTNVVIFKVANQSGPGPYGSLHFVTKDGAAPEGIEYRLTP